MNAVTRARLWKARELYARERRDAAICDLYEAGRTYRAVGALVGLSHVQVRNIVTKARAAGTPDSKELDR